MRDLGKELSALMSEFGIRRFVLVTEEINGIGTYGAVTRSFGIVAAHTIHVAVYENFEKGVVEIEDLSYTPTTAGSA